MTAGRGTGVAVLSTILFVEIVHGIEEIALLPSYFDSELGFGASAVGLVVSSYLVADLVCRTPSGWLTDRFGCRPILVGGLALTAAVIPPMVFVRDPVLLAILNVLNGVGAGTIWPAVYALVADNYAPGRRGLAMSAVNVSMMVGLASGPIIGNLTLGYFGYATGFWFCFALSIAALFVVLTFLQSPARKANAPTRSQHLEQSRHRLPLIGGASVLVAFAIAQLLPIVNLFARDVLGMNLVGLAVLLAAPALVAAFALVPFGLLADRYGRRLPALCGLLAMALPFTFGWASIDPFVVAVGATVVGLGYALVAPAINALLIDALPTGSKGVTAGLVVSLQGLGVAAGPACGGYLYEHFGPYAPLTASALALLAAFTILLPVRDTPVSVATGTRVDRHQHVERQ